MILNGVLGSVGRRGGVQFNQEPSLPELQGLPSPRHYSEWRDVRDRLDRGEIDLVLVGRLESCPCVGEPQVWAGSQTRPQRRQFLVRVERNDGDGRSGLAWTSTIWNPGARTSPTPAPATRF